MHSTLENVVIRKYVHDVTLFLIIQVLKATIDKLLKENNYSVVSLNKVFDGYFPVTAEERFRTAGVDVNGQTQQRKGQMK